MIPLLVSKNIGFANCYENIESLWQNWSIQLDQITLNQRIFYQKLRFIFRGRNLTLQTFQIETIQYSSLICER